MVSLIGKKIGMTQVFTEDGTLVPVTVLQFDPNYVVGRRTPEKNGYEAVVIGSGAVKEQRATKPYAGQFPEGVGVLRHVMEFRVFDAEVSVGDELNVDLFENVVHVDVAGISKGKGFQGVMKRHGFGGGRKTHGSKFHRANGSTGMAAYPSKVLKGTKMAGRMGGDNVTVQNLRIVQIDAENRVMLVRGAVPGARNSMVVVSAAKKKN
ncbi:50S ribosomal protein L3 [Spirochaeta africana]|uniref:Large ribosomal subunit protein uL3 n=1 Tax=Spirochaeta africana (strain ATCC 700263 / DSM 8902 / Z-7692) TaxID=889378 RepID=H9UGL2_SPIAZ|nr:50S ribosomal protein L3 [Spirochaeta africana]AFG36655.1 50S ribosomal protein L3, bacterial [Spirochaeta africana DSM 8902]